MAVVVQQSMGETEHDFGCRIKPEVTMKFRVLALDYDGTIARDNVLSPDVKGCHRR
jgi:hypothetical protein